MKCRSLDVTPFPTWITEWIAVPSSNRRLTVLAREVEDRFESVKSFKSDDTFAVLVFLSEPEIGTHVKAIWTIVDAGGMENKKILEKAVELTPEAIEGVKEPNRINFSLTHDDPFPTGDYKTEIYLNGELAKTVEFKVK